jgi:hypothetical protein
MQFYNPTFLLFAILILQCQLSIGQSATASEKWELRKDKAGIKVSTMLEEGNAIKSYKVEFRANFPKETLEHVLTDAKGFLIWTANLEECEVVGREGEYFYTRSVFDAPWPIEDREAVMKVTINKSPSVSTVTSVCAPDQIPDEGKFVRVQNSYGQWKIIKVNDTTCDLIYSGYSDPAGAIPNWMVNAFSVDVPYGSAENLLEYLEENFK